MADQDEIKPGDVVCLKSEKDNTIVHKFTAGSNFSGNDIYIYWYNSGEFKSAMVDMRALHKIEEEA